jgi:cation transport protein ChaC
VLAYLDARECAGYERRLLPFHTPGAQGEGDESPGEPLASVLVYIADHQNPNFVGPEETAATAAQVRLARGFMGPNLDYVSQLAAALASMGAQDAHVFELARALDLML